LAEGDAVNAKPIVIGGAVLLLVGAFVMKEARRGHPPATANEAGAPGTATSEPGNPLPRLIDLGADKCIPCKKMAPILDELSHTYRDVFMVEFIDVWKNPAAAKPWGLRVIPTQVFIDATGTERFRHQGFMAREAILDKWRELGVDVPSRSEPAGS
jgi:thioredoxin 1